MQKVRYVAMSQNCYGQRVYSYKTTSGTAVIRSPRMRAAETRRATKARLPQVRAAEPRRAVVVLPTEQPPGAAEARIAVTDA